MQSADWIVIAAGVAAIAWVNWYFFVAEAGPVAAARSDTGRQEVTVVVRGGYAPSTIRAVAGQPLRLVFDRQETSGCSEEVVFPDFALRRFLPAGERTTIEIVPPAPGTYDFTCGMGMLHGRVIAEGSDDVNSTTA